MTLAMAIEKRLESEIARALEIMGHVRDRPQGLNEADTKAAFIDPILSALGRELPDPAASVVKARAFVEQAVLEIYQSLRLERLGRADLFELLSGAEFQRIVPRQVVLKLHAIRKHGNVGAHEGQHQRPGVANGPRGAVRRRPLALREPSSRADRGHPELPAAAHAPEDSKGQLQREKREALQKPAAQEARFQETLNELAAARDAQSVAEAEAARLQQELTTRGAAAVDELHFDEKTTRRRLIDSMLIDAGWNIGPNGANTDETT